MKRILKLIALVALPVLLGACMPTEEFAGCSASGRVCVEGVTAGGALNGRVVTAWETTTPQGTSYSQETSTPLGGELAKIAVGSVLPAAINAGTGIAIANRQCSEDCGGGTQINVAGAQAGASSTSVAENTSTGTIRAGGFCTNVAPDGSCRQ